MNGLRAKNWINRSCRCRGDLDPARRRVASARSGRRSTRSVAIIVSLADGSSRDRAFEFLKQGTVLKLGAGGTAVIGYFKSCVQEAIESGVVTIGETQSDIRGGIVTREQVECDGSKLVLTPEQLAASAVTVNRGPEGTAATSVVTLYSTKPYIMLKDPSTTVVIRRVDVAGEPLAIETVKISSSPTIRVPKKPLQPGNVYRVTVGNVSRVLRIDRNARAAAVPLLSKMLLL